MVLESMWADAPDSDKVAVPPKKSQNKKTSPTKNKKGTTRRKSGTHGQTNRPKEKLEEEKPKNRLVFSVKDVQVKTSSSDEPTEKPKRKTNLLKKKIEEQKKIREKAQHEKEQKDLLAEFLSGDAKFTWGEEDEENEIIEKLNSSLKV